MSVYQFKIWGKRFAVDIESGNFFEVDNAASEAISLLHSHSKEETLNKLGKKYGNKTAKITTRNLFKLEKNNVLFSPSVIKNTIIKRRVTDLTLNIVNNCNLRCRYCWNENGGYGRSSDNRKMTAPTAFKAVDLLVKESGGAKDLVVDFYGGEPLINFDLIKQVINYCRKIQSRTGKKFRFLLATNATLLTKEKGEFLIENGVDIAVSLDGSRKIQDTQRPFPDGKGSFEVVMGNINSLREEYRRRIVGRATFTPYSTKLISTFKFLRSLGFERIEICESEKAGYGLEKNSRFFFSGEKGLRYLKSLYYDLANFYAEEVINGNLTYENTYFNRFFKQLSRLYNIQSVVGACSAGFSLISADIDGSIYPCTAFVGASKFKIGTVKTGIEENKLRKFLDIKICSNDACNSCWAKKICRGCGSCYNLNYFTNNNLGKPDQYYCELFRYKTKLMIAMICRLSKNNPLLLDEVLIPEYYATRGRVKKN